MKRLSKNEKQAANWIVLNWCLHVSIVIKHDYVEQRAKVNYRLWFNFNRLKSCLEYKCKINTWKFSVFFSTWKIGFVRFIKIENSIMTSNANNRQFLRISQKLKSIKFFN